MNDKLKRGPDSVINETGSEKPTHELRMRLNKSYKEARSTINRLESKIRKLKNNKKAIPEKVVDNLYKRLNDAKTKMRMVEMIRNQFMKTTVIDVKIGKRDLGKAVKALNSLVSAVTNIDYERGTGRVWAMVESNPEDYSSLENSRESWPEDKEKNTKTRGRWRTAD